MKLNNLIWPHKYIGLTMRNMIMGLVVVLWVGSIYYHFSYLNTVSALHLVALYLIFLMWCFLNNRTMPIGAILVEYEKDSQGVQLQRFIKFLICIVALWYCLLP